MTSLRPEVKRLLAMCPEDLPLVRTALPSRPEACSIKAADSGALFPGARHAQAACAGLLLRAGCWEESHCIAQDVSSVEGSYWHAILHRIEPDSGNSAYWFARVGRHAIFPDLHRLASRILAESGPPHWQLEAAWEPNLFIRWCEEARKMGGLAEGAATAIQMAEWKLLFAWCTASKAPRDSALPHGARSKV
jgi:hypothetical protein